MSFNELGPAHRLDGTQKQNHLHDPDQDQSQCPSVVLTPVDGLPRAAWCRAAPT